MATAPLQTLWRLSDESTVDINLLAESIELVTLIKNGSAYDELIAWVNENF